MKVISLFIITISLNIIASRKIIQGTKNEPVKAESAFLRNQIFRPEYVPIYEAEDVQQQEPDHQQILQNIEAQYHSDKLESQSDSLQQQKDFLLQRLQQLLASDPLLAAIILSQTLGLSTTGITHGQNHPQHPLPNPYVSLLLSHYGRYLKPHHVSGRIGHGIYGYMAANNLHNNQPFGAYKLYKDVDV